MVFPCSCSFCFLSSLLEESFKIQGTATASRVYLGWVVLCPVPQRVTYQLGRLQGGRRKNTFRKIHWCAGGNKLKGIPDLEYLLTLRILQSGGVKLISQCFLICGSPPPRAGDHDFNWDAYTLKEGSDLSADL